MKKPLVNTMLRLTAKAVGVVTGVIMMKLLTRGLGVEAYGGMVLIGAVGVVLDSVADFGSKVIGVRELSVAKTGEERRDVYGNLVILRMVMAGVAIMIGLILGWWWPGFEGFRFEACVAVLMVGLSGIVGSMEIVWQWSMKLKIKVTSEILFSVLNLLGIWWWQDNLNLLLVVGWLLGTRLLTLLLEGWWARKTAPKFGWQNVSLAGISKVLKMIWPMGFYLLIFAGYDRAVDSMMIERYLGIREVAWYGLAYKIYLVMVQPAYYFVSSVFPLLAIKENQKKVFGGAIKWLVAGLGLMVPLAYVLAPFGIMVLGGKEFAPAIEVLRILLVALVFSFMGHLSGFGLISAGRQKEVLLIGLVSLGLNLGFNIGLIPRLGIRGAAISTVLTELSACFLMTWRWARLR